MDAMRAMIELEEGRAETWKLRAKSAEAELETARRLILRAFPAVSSWTAGTCWLKEARMFLFPGEYAPDSAADRDGAANG